ncbi:uncharacterized protein [Cherax quadricarinatus]|uniref:uncharacterized protein n=1 Tax=Cherax quadricarinatus TaxID=27406 RepID=UPI0023793D48|nr:uncharacterized protein LOC128704422 [Cherax quadricarinatus]
MSHQTTPTITGSATVVTTAVTTAITTATIMKTTLASLLLCVLIAVTASPVSKDATVISQVSADDPASSEIFKDAMVISREAPDSSQVFRDAAAISEVTGGIPEQFNFPDDAVAFLASGATSSNQDSQGDSTRKGRFFIPILINTTALSILTGVNNNPWRKPFIPFICPGLICNSTVWPWPVLRK